MPFQSQAVVYASIIALAVDSGTSKTAPNLVAKILMFVILLVTASETILLNKVDTKLTFFISVSHQSSIVSRPSSPVIQDHLFILVV